jgi:hypothetical protein
MAIYDEFSVIYDKMEMSRIKRFFVVVDTIVMTSRQHIIYSCNPVYVWDGTSESHYMRGPM